eukprot:362452-Chlamydomonas_euryale.AAC.11
MGAKVARIISVDGAVGGTTHKVEVTSEFYTDYFVLVRLVSCVHSSRRASRSSTRWRTPTCAACH